ncbi:MAG: hypothetical protein JWM16_162 [Verrucomicrobiales bacterium]|nr:hypothetical protein [Verrucomicrobiales bacterium]
MGIQQKEILHTPCGAPSRLTLPCRKRQCRPPGCGSAAILGGRLQVAWQTFALTCPLKRLDGTTYRDSNSLFLGRKECAFDAGRRPSAVGTARVHQQRQTAFFTKTFPLGLLFASRRKVVPSVPLRHALQFLTSCQVIPVLFQATVLKMLERCVNKKSCLFRVFGA